MSEVRRVAWALRTFVMTVRWYCVGASLIIRHARDWPGERLWTEVDGLRLRYGLTPYPVCQGCPYPACQGCPYAGGDR